MTNHIADPTAATPEQIDTRLAALTKAVARSYQEIDQQLDMARRAFGETPMRDTSRTRKTRVWRTTNEQTRERLVVRAKDADPDTTWSMYNEAKILETLVTAEQATIEANTEIAELEAEYGRRQWSRFFIVTSSDGHIHRSRSCSTCRETTEYGWLPQLSGRTEADAVEAHGPLLCTVCYPSAPVEWTHKPTPKHCTGTTPVPGTITTWARGAYGECPDCHQKHPVLMGNRLRKHKPAN
jgi:hypothetical protein